MAFLEGFISDGLPVGSRWLEGALRPCPVRRKRSASNLPAAGEDIFTVSRSLGHATIGTTADLYGHIDRASLRRSADRLEAILSA